MQITIKNFQEILIEWWGVVDGKDFLFKVELRRDPLGMIAACDNWMGVFGPFSTIEKALEDVECLFLSSRS